MVGFIQAGKIESANGVDIKLIRLMLSMISAEYLLTLQQDVKFNMNLLNVLANT